MPNASPTSNTHPNPDAWKDRAQAKLVSNTQLAALNPARGLVTADHDGLPQLHAWNVTTGAFRPLTNKPGGVGFGLLSPGGTFVYYMDDTGGSEIGRYVRVPFDGGPPEAVTPDLPPWPAYDEGDVVHILGNTIEARPNPQAGRFAFLGSFRADGVLPMRWREVA